MHNKRTRIDFRTSAVGTPRQQCAVQRPSLSSFTTEQQPADKRNWAIYYLLLRQMAAQNNDNIDAVHEFPRGVITESRRLQFVNKCIEDDTKAAARQTQSALKQNK